MISLLLKKRGRTNKRRRVSNDIIIIVSISVKKRTKNQNQILEIIRQTKREVVVVGDHPET